MIWLSIVIGAGYLFGAIVSGCVFAAWGLRNPHTVDDSWTGDNALDTWSVILWPISLLAVAAMFVGGRLAKVA